MDRREFLRIAGTGASLAVLPGGYGIAEESRKKNRTAGPEWMRRASPESQGIPSSAVISFIDEAEETLDTLHSVMIARNGRIVVEGWWAPWSAELNHMLYSLSKPFTATAIGIAQAEGRLRVEDRVLSFFPDERPEHPSRNLKAMTIRDLLRMTPGHAGSADRAVMGPDDDAWTKAWLAYDVKHVPGTHWAYSNSVTYMLSAIIQKVTGERLLDYLGPRLFDPLGIANPIWGDSPEGVTLGGFGLRIKTEDILRFGQLYLQRGEWAGRRLVPEAWIAEATTRQAGGDPGSEGFGYQFWINPGGSYGGGGAFGQQCAIIPDKNAVIAITAGVRLSAARTVLDLVRERLIGNMRESPLPDNRFEHETLLRKLNDLSVSPPAGRSASPLTASVSGRKFEFPRNRHRLRNVTLAERSGHTVLTLADSNEGHEFVCANGRWIPGRTRFEAPIEGGLEALNPEREAPFAASGCWTADDTFTLRICYTESSPISTLTLRFEEQRVEFDRFINTRPMDRLTLVGSAS